MNDFFSEERYNSMIEALFCRFPSFQKVGAGAYKPGIANMEFADQLMGHPHRKYRIIHVAGTNGKGSVSNMLASVLSSCGLRVGLYTSPHILDFRERMRVVEPCDGGRKRLACVQESEASSGAAFRLIPKQDVWDFIMKWKDTFDHLDMSFFEITTLMALDWFAGQEVDLVVLETGLGGRLDSTNIVTPVLSVITNIGLDHCDMLGETLPEIAFEKAGIIKPKVPVVVGESNPETDSVFERKVLYTNLPEPSFMGSRSAIMDLLVFADKVEPAMWHMHETLLAQMDLRGDYQKKNLRTVLAALDVLKNLNIIDSSCISRPSESSSDPAPADASCTPEHCNVSDSAPADASCLPEQCRVSDPAPADASCLPEHCNLSDPAPADASSSPEHCCVSDSAPADALCLAGCEQERNCAVMNSDHVVADALIHAAARTGFRGRWEIISKSPLTICDIGHNEHGLKYNFAQLEDMRRSGEVTDLIVVYGSVADKDIDAVIHLMPEDATYIFTQASSKRALPADSILNKYIRFRCGNAESSDCDPGLSGDGCVKLSCCGLYTDPSGEIEHRESDCDSFNACAVNNVKEAVSMARNLAEDLLKSDPSARPLIYIGGSTYIVSEAIE